MRNYTMLSDHDFELLVADLLGAQDGVVYEAFARGADQGVDVRRLTSDGPDVVQCKHMLNSTYSQLKSSAKNEAKSLKKLSPQPYRYRFVTSMSLTQHRKSELAAILSPWITQDDQILGAEDLEGLLNRHQEVERAHIKLWLASAAQLDERIHAATWVRSRQLHDEIMEWLPRYVENQSFWDARRQLRARRVLVISGPPGIGKTTLARMLLADAAIDGYQPVEVSADIEEAFEIVNDHEARVFYYDDFLGSTFLQERLAKNEDKRLTSFMRRCSNGSNNLLVLTTREHILQQAASWYEELERAQLPLRRFLLELSAYTRFDRARILYNHIWHAGEASVPARHALLENDSYLKIIDHPNYNPRLIEYITGFNTGFAAQEEQGFVEFALEILDNPDRIWERAFERQLDDHCRALLLAVATTGTQVVVDDARRAFESLIAASGDRATFRDFRSSLRVLDDSFLRSTEDSHHTFIDVANPSVQDFVATWLIRNPDQALVLVKGAIFFEQLVWLYRKLEPAVEAWEYVRAALLEGMKRCFDSDNPAWIDVRSAGTDHIFKFRGGPQYEERLLFIRPFLSTDEGSALKSWFDNEIEATAGRWKSHVRDPSKPVTLIRTLRKEGFPLAPAIIEAAREGLRNKNYSYAWSEMARLRTIVPEAFAPEIDSVLISECESWLRSQLIDPDDIEDLDELYAVRSSAESMGAWSSDFEELYDRAAEIILEREIESDDPDDDEPDRDSPSMSPNSENAAIEALFSRLGEPFLQTDEYVDPN